MKVAIDAMGGDHAPEEILLGAMAAVKDYGCDIVLVGDETLLRATIGHRQAARSAILVDRAAGNDRADPIVVADRIAEPLEHEYAAAFTAHVAVGGGVEGLAPPDRGKHPGP